MASDSELFTETTGLSARSTGSRHLLLNPSEASIAGAAKYRLVDDSDDFTGKSPSFGSKTIGLAGGVMLMINNLAGPTISLMPGLCQEAGWLAMLLFMALVGGITIWCGKMLIVAMRSMPGNEDLSQRAEFEDITSFFFSWPFYLLTMLCYYVYLILTLMTYIIQSGQVLDYLFLDFFNCAPGLAFSPSLQFVCGKLKDDITPFGNISVLSSSMGIVGVVCVPFALLNLDDNVVMQWIAVVGLTVMATIWFGLLVTEPAFPHSLPAMTASQSNMVGVLLFNFASMSAVPSWVNEKRPEVSVCTSLWASIGYVVLVYTLVGIIGGMAFLPFYTTDDNLFSKLNASGSAIGRLTVAVYPFLQNFTTIPVLAILIRYNLMRAGLSKHLSTVTSIAMPWLLSVPFYTGKGFASVAAVGGLATSLVINFIVPCAVFCLASRGEFEEEQTEQSIFSGMALACRDEFEEEETEQSSFSGMAAESFSELEGESENPHCTLKC